MRRKRARLAIVAACLLLSALVPQEVLAQLGPYCHPEPDQECLWLEGRCLEEYCGVPHYAPSVVLFRRDADDHEWHYWLDQTLSIGPGQVVFSYDLYMEDGDYSPPYDMFYGEFYAGLWWYNGELLGTASTILPEDVPFYAAFTFSELRTPPRTRWEIIPEGIVTGPARVD